MDRSSPGGDHATATECEQQAARSYEVSVEALNEREQSGSEDDVDDPFSGEAGGTDRLLKSDGGHELLAGQSMPGSNKGDSGDAAGIKQDPDDDCHPDRTKETRGAEFGARFFSSFADGFEARHEIRYDLHDQHNRDEAGVREQRWEVRRRAATETETNEDDE